MGTYPYVLRVVGGPWGARRLVDARKAFAGCCAAEARAELEQQSFLTVFQFGPAMKSHLDANGGRETGFDGPTWGQWIWWDLDDTDPQRALDNARGLASLTLDRYHSLDDEDLLLFISGSKGYHMGLPTSLLGAVGGPDFHRQARALALALAGRAGVKIDESVYTRTHLIRAPNSTHSKTGLRKRRLTVEELLGLSVERIRRLAAEPLAFEVPPPPALDARAAADWAQAGEAAQAEAKAKEAARMGLQDGEARLTRSTRDFLRDGANTGDRHRLLFSAAANMGEFPTVDALAFALLEPVGLDTGLPPHEVRRQIETGLRHGQNQRPTGPTPSLVPAQTEVTADA